MSINKNQQGFTLPEVVIVLSITAIFSSLILFFAFSYWRYGSLMEADLDTFVTRLNAGDILRENISSSTGMVIQNSIPDSYAHVTDPDDATNTFWQPIHAIPGNTPMAAEDEFTPIAYFKRMSFDSTGEAIINEEQPYEDEYILYLDGSEKRLMMRVLANPNAPNNRATSTCPPPSATPTCPRDRLIAADVASVDLRFFSRTGGLIDYTAAYDPDIGEYIGPDYPSVEVVEFKLNLTQKSFLQTTNATNNSTIIRIALRNK
jgi:prepilin-type N-terminal cleavage/methylation domain-containing protein